MQEHQPYTAGMYIQKYSTGEVSLKEVIAAIDPSELPTRREHIARPPMKRLALPERAQSRLPVGSDGRAFLVARSEMSTLDILKVVVKEFFLSQHEYPEFVEMDSYRWGKYGVFTYFFYPHADLAIPLRCAESNEYDVVCRGKAHTKKEEEH